MEQGQFLGESYEEAFLLLKDRVFRHLNDAMLHNIIKQSDQLHLRSGEILFAEEDESNYVYVVIRGRLGTHLSVAHLTASPTGFFSRGSLIGEVGVIGNTPRTMAAIAYRDTQLLRLSAEVFKEIYFCVIAENPKQMQELYLMQLNRNKKLFSRMREKERYVFKILICLQENFDLDQTIGAIENLNDQKKKLLFLKAERLKLISNQNDRVSYLEQLEAEYQNIVIVISPNALDFIESALDFADKIILIGNGDVLPSDADKLFFDQFLRTQSRYKNNTFDIILMQEDREARRNGHKWTSLMPGLIVYYSFREDESSLARLYRYFSGQQIGLVLGGCGYRGMAYIGIVKALVDYQIPIDVIGGTSIGAIIGCAFSIATNMAQFDSFMQQLEAVMRRAFSWKELDLPIHSIFTGQSIWDFSETSPIEYIEDMLIPFFCVSCDLWEKQEVHHTQGRIADALRATSAIPGLLPPVAVNGRLLVDGGVVNNLPTDVMRSYVDNSGIIISTEAIKNERIRENDSFKEKHGLLKSIKNAFLMKKNSKDIAEILLQALLFSQESKEKANIKLSTICIKQNLATHSILPAGSSKQALLIQQGYDATVMAIQNDAYLAKYIKK